MRLVRTQVIAIAAGFALGLGAVWLFAPQPIQPAADAVEVLGSPRPVFELTDLAGAPVALDRFDGRPVLVNFWATWCRPCRREMPLLQQVADLHAETLTVLGIALDQPDQARAFLDGLGIGYPNLIAGAQADAIQRAFGNRQRLLPYTVVVDAEGIIRWRHLGELDERLIAEALQQVGVETEPLARRQDVHRLRQRMAES